MLFYTLEFLFFVLLVTSAYFATPGRLRWLVLLIASYAFVIYLGWFYLLLLVLSTIFNYSIVLMLGRQTRPEAKKKWLWAAIAINVMFLFGFKCTFLFQMGFGALTANLAFQAGYQYLVPIGISYYTFQNISYVLDVYYGDTRAEKHLGLFALYLSFFPRLLAGPIERSYDLLPQLRNQTAFSMQRLSEGTLLILRGLFKKLVIADRLALIVQQIFGNIQDYQGIPIIIAANLFVYQIYCDFSGYSDIARGLARILGFNFVNNFERPFTSRNPTEFWQRWHVSLSTWIRDYLFIPIYRKTNSIPAAQVYTMTLMGLWHGVSWNHIAWGVYWGVVIYLHLTLKNRFRKHRFEHKGIRRISDPLKLLATIQLVAFSALFFRSESITDAFYAVGHLFGPFDTSQLVVDIGLGWMQYLILAAAVLMLETTHVIQGERSLAELARTGSNLIGALLLLFFIAAVLLLGVDTPQPFIYERF